MIWTIAFGIVLGLIIWNWVLPLVGLVLIQSAFWRFVGKILFYLSTVIGIIALANYFFYGGNTDWGLWFLVPAGIKIFKSFKKPTTETKQAALLSATTASHSLETDGVVSKNSLKSVPADLASSSPTTPVVDVDPGFDTRHTFDWSEHPGCFEKHLIRRYHNPLFSEGRQIVTEDEFNEAKLKDKEELIKFKQGFEPFIILIGSIFKSATVADLIATRKNVDSMLESAIEIGGDIEKEISQLRRLSGAILDDLIQTFERQKDETNSLDSFKRLKELESNQEERISNAFLAQMGREDSPIQADEVIPSLLSEDIETVRVAYKFVLSTAIRDEDLKKEIALLLVKAAAQAEKNGDRPGNFLNNFLNDDFFAKLRALGLDKEVIDKGFEKL